MVLLVILGTIVVSLALALAVLWWRKRRTTARRAAAEQRQQAADQQDAHERKTVLENLLTRVEAGEPEALQELTEERFDRENRYLRDKLASGEERDALRRRLRDAYWSHARPYAVFLASIDEIRELYGNWRVAEELVEEAHALYSLLQRLFELGEVRQLITDQLGVTTKQLQTRMLWLLRKHWASLTSNLTSEERIRAAFAFRQTEFIAVISGNKKGTFKYPENWYEAVTNHVYDPGLSLYGEFDRKQAGINLHQRAADALETGGWQTAKFLLAVCDAFTGNREAMGEHFRDELAKLVSQHQPHLGPRH